MNSSDSPPGTRTIPVPAIWSVLVIAGVGVHAAWSMLDRGFLSDDFSVIYRFGRLPWSEWPGLFLKDWWDGFWGHPLPELRPFVALPTMVEARLWGSHPMGYRITNLVVYIATGWILVAIIRLLRPQAGWAIPTLGGCLFLLHPSHAEAVGMISGRTDLFSGWSLLTSFYLCLRWMLRPVGSLAPLPLAGAWFLYGVALFSKESSIVLPGLVAGFLLVYWSDLPSQQRVRKLVILFAGLASLALVYLLCRYLAFGSIGSGSLRLLQPEFLERQVSYLAWLLPVFLRALQHNYDLIVPHAPTLLAALALGAGVGLAGWAAWRRRITNAWRAVGFFGLGWYVMTTWVLAGVTYFAARHIYLASAGTCIALALLATHLPRARTIGVLLLVSAVVYGGSLYHEELSRWRRATKVSERLVAAVENEVGVGLPAGTVLLLDAPDVWNGVFTWAWTTPQSVQPPFVSIRPAWVVERPSVYMMPHAWLEHRQPARLLEAEAAVLLAVDERGQVRRETLDMTLFRAAVTTAWTAPSSLAVEERWKEFVSQLRPADR